MTAAATATPAAERNTLQQQIVHCALRRLANHPTAEEVYDAVHADYPSISKATVYRVLNKLSSNGTILKVPISNGADHYDHQTHEHFHIHCDSCGKVDDVDVSDHISAARLAHAVTDGYGYVLTGFSFQFNGVCPACSAKQTPTTSPTAATA